MSTIEFIASLSEVANAFEACGISYVVGGSVASSLHGTWRTTEDADIAAKMRFDQVPPFCNLVRDRFSVHEPAVVEAVTRRSSFSLIHFEHIDKIDIFVVGDSDFDNAQFTRAVQCSFPPEFGSPRQFPTTSPEDIVLHKLMWYEKGNRVSERQWRDVVAVLSVNSATLDQSHLDRWAPELGVAELLDEARAQVR